MIETRGDIWRMRADALVITTNGIVKADGAAVMGAGIARAAQRRYPGIDARLGELIRSRGNVVHLLHRGGAEPWQREARAVVAYPTKEHFRNPSPLDLIERGAAQLAALADTEGWEHIVLPRPGCGLGGLDWGQEVRPAIAPLLDDRFFVSSGP